MKFSGRLFLFWVTRRCEFVLLFFAVNVTLGRGGEGELRISKLKSILPILNTSVEVTNTWWAPPTGRAGSPTARASSRWRTRAGNTHTWSSSPTAPGKEYFRNIFNVLNEIFSLVTPTWETWRWRLGNLESNRYETEWSTLIGRDDWDTALWLVDFIGLLRHKDSAQGTHTRFLLCLPTYHSFFLTISDLEWLHSGYGEGRLLYIR